MNIVYRTWMYTFDNLTVGAYTYFIVNECLPTLRSLIIDFHSNPIAYSFSNFEKKMSKGMMAISWNSCKYTQKLLPFYYFFQPLYSSSPAGLSSWHFIPPCLLERSLHVHISVCNSRSELSTWALYASIIHLFVNKPTNNILHRIEAKAA